MTTPAPTNPPQPQTSTPRITMDVLLFGPQAALAQTQRIAIEIQPGATTCEHALRLLGETCAALSVSLPASRLAVNHALAEPSAVLQGTEELALIGMVGGG